MKLLFYREIRFDNMYYDIILALDVYQYRDLELVNNHQIFRR